MEVKSCCICSQDFESVRVTHVACSSKCKNRAWYLKNHLKKKAATTEYHKIRPSQDEGFRLARNLRKRLRTAIFSEFKTGSAVNDLGCSIPELKTYLESKFVEGMNWENYGRFGWHIDHILPLSKFDLTKIEELRKACHYTNLQPMWWKENLRKSNGTTQGR